MAYNPFNIFRRNQKAIFAAVTVVIMFVFVMSSGLSGGNDFFDWLPRWLGKKTAGRKGEPVCKLDGERLYDGDIEALRFQRVMANAFMLQAAGSAASALGQYADQQMQQITDPESKRMLTEGQNAVEQLSNPQLQRFLSIPSLRPQFQKMEMAAATFMAIPNSPTAKPAEKEIVRARQCQLNLQQQLTRTRGALYFSNLPNGSTSDVLEFALWQKKADRLGIAFTGADVNQLIQKEFYGFFRSSAELMVSKELRREFPGRFTIEACIKAIGEEFRVRTAQQMILGPSLVFNSADKLSGRTIFGIPYEIFEFYRDKCSPTDYEAIPVPAAGFVDKVVGEPSEDELKRLYDKYKDDEPNPDRETPGFKTPRLAKLEWLSAVGTEPYYRKLATESLKMGELQAKVGSMMSVPMAGSGPGWAIAATSPLLPADPLLAMDGVRSDYATSIVDRHNSILDNEWTKPSFVTQFLDTSIVRPTNLAAALGGSIGGSLTLGGPLTGVATLETAIRAFELRDRIVAGAPAFAGAVPGPSMFSTVIGAEASLRSMLPKPLPIAVARPELIERLTDRTAKQLLLTDLKNFSTRVAEMSSKYKLADQSIAGLQGAKVPEAVISKLAPLKNKDWAGVAFLDELAKLLAPDELKEYQPAILKQAEVPQSGPLKDKAPIEKYIAEFVASRGLQHGASDKLRSEWTMEEDPGLAPLRAVLDRSGHGDTLGKFGKKFFWAEQALGMPRTPVSGLFKPEYYPNAPSNFESPEAKPEPKFLVWRTEEVRAQPAKDFQAAKELVRAAWKRMKARELAKNRAEALANAIRNSAGELPQLIDQNMLELANALRNEIADPKAKERVKAFPIGSVAPLSGGDMMGYRKFEIGESKNIPYPPKNMADTLLEERTKPPKTTFIIADAPKDTYYVVTLKSRSLKSVEDFYFSVYLNLQMPGGSPTAQARQQIVGNFLDDAQKKTVESILDMLKQEFGYEVTDEQKKKLEQKKSQDEDKPSPGPFE